MVYGILFGTLRWPFVVLQEATSKSELGARSAVIFIKYQKANQTQRENN